jgi:hypothetical protein
MKNVVFWNVTPCGFCKNDVSKELSAFFISVARIGELGITLAATSNRRTLRRNIKTLYCNIQEDAILRKHACSRSRYLLTRVQLLHISQPLSSNGSLCRNARSCCYCSALHWSCYGTNRKRRGPRIWEQVVEACFTSYLRQQLQGSDENCINLIQWTCCTDWHWDSTR